MVFLVKLLPSQITMFILICLIYIASWATCSPQRQFPLANRPQYAPRPSASLIGQIVPSGQPWPANAADYEKFSQTTRRNAETPVWATSPPTPTPTFNHRLPEVDDRLPNVDALPDHKRWGRPTIIFHEPFLRNSTTTTATSAITSKQRPLTATAITARTPMVNKLPEIELFTSAPISTPEAPDLTDSGIVGVANLLPDGAVTIRRP